MINLFKYGRLLSRLNFPFSRLNAAISSAFVLLMFFGNASWAHHPFEFNGNADLSPLNGLISGIAHPLLGPDHCLFLVAISFIGLKRPRSWVLPLLATGLAGSALAQVVLLPEFVSTFAETLVSMSLVVEGLIAYKVLPNGLLLPTIILHGYLLGSTIVGAESQSIASYFLGLMLVQGGLLTLVTGISNTLLARIGDSGRNLAAGIWMGIGMAFTWTILIP